ncbi:hypothetical protein EDB87DRAFT_1834544 [Lactarius vividus]|nr:hypothetical protein EDB87DRAFT_1834544 [Lactarius vividus]
MRQKSDEASLQTRHRDGPGPDVSNPHKLDTQPLLHPKEVHGDSTDFSDSNEREDEGLFGIFDVPSTCITEAGVTVRVRDMVLTKGKFERTSKAFLQAAVNKLDSFAVTTYCPLSGVSRVHRASVSIRWGSEKISEWTMTDVACYDMTQAEQYIATVALHALTFPASAGFASGNCAWRQAEILLVPASGISAVWAKLKRIVETKSNQEKEKAVDESSLQPARSIESSATKNSRETSTQIKFAFESRQSSSLYKEILSQRNKLPIAQYRSRIVECLVTSQVLY